MKKGTLVILAELTLVTLILAMVASPIQTSAAIVWFDDFEDGNYDGWFVTEGWFNVFNYRSYVLVCSMSPFAFPATHPSTIVNGTWSLDFYHSDMEFQEIKFVLSSDGEYRVIIDDGNIRLTWYIDGFIGQLDSYDVDIDGWQHIDITRDLEGETNVFLNNTHVLQGVHTEINSCENFTVGLRIGGAIDNVTVSDTVDKVCTNELCEVCQTTTATTTTAATSTTTTSTTTTTTTTTDAPPPIPMEFLLIGGGVAVAVIVLVVYFMKR